METGTEEDVANTRVAHVSWRYARYHLLAITQSHTLLHSSGETEGGQILYPYIVEQILVKRKMASFVNCESPMVSSSTSENDASCPIDEILCVETTKMRLTSHDSHLADLAEGNTTVSRLPTVAPEPRLEVKRFGVCIDTPYAIRKSTRREER
jgi:hypothetical protein